jgi:hypothetical protein
MRPARIAQIALVVAASMAMAHAAFAQDAPPMIPGDPQATAQLARIIDATRAQRLPVDPIVGKVQYALMMHAPSARIIAAAQAVAGRLAMAREALAPRDTPEDIVAGESALSLRVPRETVRDIRRFSKEPSVAVPLAVIGQLVDGGVPPDRASDIVKDLIKRGASGPQLAALQRSVAEDVRYGTKAENALDLRMSGLRAVLAPGAAATAATAASATDPHKGKP